MLNIRIIEEIEMPILKRTLLIDSLCECLDAVRAALGRISIVVSPETSN